MTEILAANSGPLSSVANFLKAASAPDRAAFTAFSSPATPLTVTFGSFSWQRPCSGKGRGCRRDGVGGLKG